MPSNYRIVHFGLGAFHRSHQAYYLHLLNEQLPVSKRWYYTSVNLRPETRAIPAALKAQNGRFYFKRIAPDGSRQYIDIRSIEDVVDAAEDTNRITFLFDDERIKALSITVTESGYYFSDSSELDLAHSEILNDIAFFTKGAGKPTTIYGFLSLALMARRGLSHGAITVLTCDNIRDNGSRLKTALMRFMNAAKLTGLQHWVDKNVTFPCSMVDRITPVPPQGLAEEIFANTGFNDACPIMGEDFEQWVIEDNFAQDFPPLEKVGVSIVPSVHVYEEAKIRILNGAHFMLSYIGALRGYKTFDENIRDAELNQLLRQYHQREVIPTIENAPFDLEVYRGIIVSRFSNTYIGDSISRIAMDSISKFPQFILPTLRKNLRRGHQPEASIILIAHWYCFLFLHATDRFHFDYKDPYGHIVDAWISTGDPIQAFLSEELIWQGLTQRFPLFSFKLQTAITDTLEYYRERDL